MFSFFKPKPVFQDEAFRDLSFMLTQDEEDPTFKRALLNPDLLDFSLESLRHLDEYLSVLHKAPPTDPGDMMRVVLRCGAYLGEVVRRHNKTEFHWLDFKEAARRQKLVKKAGMSLGLAGVLWAPSGTMCFPLVKICKYIENGEEDSAYHFARVGLECLPDAAK